MTELFDWAKTASAISVGAIPDWMLQGYRTKPQGQGEPRRHQIMGEGPLDGDPEFSSNPYHKDGTVSFIDAFEAPDRVNIGYASTEPKHRGQGHFKALMNHVYNSYPDKPIYWGDRLHEASDHLFDQYRKTHPERTARVAGPELAENWVYLHHKDFPPDHYPIRTGKQPHHLLIHKFDNLDGEPIMGKLGNTWLADNGIPPGEEHHIARGTFDKKGRPQIWESNIDRNDVYDALLKHQQQKTAARAEQHTYALMSRKGGERADDAPWNIDSTHLTQEEAEAARVEGQRLVMFPRGEEIHPLGYYQRLAADGQRFYMPSLVFQDETGRVTQCPNIRGTYDYDEARRSILDYPAPEGLSPFAYIDSYIEGGDPVATHEREHVIGQKPRVYRGHVAAKGDVVPMPLLDDEGGHAYEKMVCSHCGSDDLRNGRCHDCGSDDQYGTYTVYVDGNPTGRNNMDGTMTMLSYGTTETAEEMYAKIQGMGWDVVSEGPKGDHYSVVITNPQGGKNERLGDSRELAFASALTWAWQHSHFSKDTTMDLPVTQKATLGQVFANLRPSKADGNHLGLQAHKLGYSIEELTTFLEAQEDAGTPRGWKTFKDASVAAYASRGWKRMGAFTLEVYPLQGDMIRSTVQNEDIENIKKQYSQEFNNGEIHRARLVDPMTGRSSWDTDDEWRTNAPKQQQWQQGQEIPIEQDWAFSTRPAA